MLIGSVLVKRILLVAAVFMLPVGLSHTAKAGYQWETFGGELEVAGFIDAEARMFAVSGPTYLNQAITRLQIEATLSWEDIGVFDEIAFTVIARPQFDWAYYFGDRGEDPSKRPISARRFNADTGTSGYSGFGIGLNTGGLAKNVLQGIWDADVLDNEFAVIGGEALPYVYPLTDRNQSCRNCQDVDDDSLAVAFGATDSSGRLYPLREAYADLRFGDVWIRIGKQQIVWGKTDFFRMQDIINPVDFGPHFFFDSFEDIRIPQWILSAQWRPGSFGPFTDTAVQLVWNFDRFRRIGAGAAYSPWGTGFARQMGTFALYNTYFSPEPCAPRAGLSCGSDPDGTGAGVYPSGFGIPLGMLSEDVPSWKFDETEIGIRIEGRIWKVRFAITDYWGYDDVPAVGFRTNNLSLADLPNGTMPAGTPTCASQAALGLDPINCSDVMWIDRTLGLNNGGLPVWVVEPGVGAAAAAALGDVNAAAAVAAGNPDQFYWAQSTGSGRRVACDPDCPAGLAKVLGGQTVMEYKKTNTLGLALDYFDDFTGVVFRVESSWSDNTLVVNTDTFDWLDTTDVIKFSLGMDRPTFIKWLNPTRTFFLSSQIFLTHLKDHHGKRNDGMLIDKNNWVFTFFAQGQYMRDRLTPEAFVVWEQNSNSWVTGAQVQYLINNNWSVLFGAHVIWGGHRENEHDTGQYTVFATDHDGIQDSGFGQSQEGLGSLRERDEIFFRLRYSF